MELDLDALLIEEQAEKVVWVQLDDDDLFPEGFIKIKVKVPSAKVRNHLYTKHYGAEMVLNPDGRRRNQTVTLKTDYEGYIRGIKEYIIGWDGIKGDFNLKKLLNFFDAYPEAGQAFARGCLGAFGEVSKRELEAKTDELKNSNSTSVG